MPTTRRFYLGMPCLPPFLGKTALLLAFFIAISGLLTTMAAPKAVTGAKKPTIPPLEHKSLPQGTLYTITVPKHAGFKVVPMLSKTLATVESPLWQNLARPAKPVFLINGGFFDPHNSLTTSFIFQGGTLTGDPRINPQLVNNPKLIPYLPKIFNRSEFRVYVCQKQKGPFETRYDITLHDDPIPESCLLKGSLGAGPSLLPTLEDQAEAFVDYDAAGKRTRDPIGVCAKNARSAVGITADGAVILMMGAQNPAEPKNSGFSLADMANLLKTHGAIKAMALDGGSSSSLFYAGKPVFGRLTSKGALVKRPVKSVLMVIPNP